MNTFLPVFLTFDQLTFAYVSVGSNGRALVLGMSSSAILTDLSDCSDFSDSDSELVPTNDGGPSSESDEFDVADGDSLRKVSRLME